MELETGDRRAVGALARQLELCRISPDSVGVVLFDVDTEPAMVEIAVEALTRVGAAAHAVAADDGLVGGTVPDLAASGPPDIVVNLLSGHSDAAEAIIPAYARVLSVTARSLGDLRGVVPHAGLGRRVARGIDLLETGQELHVGDDQGTNLRIGLVGARRWKHDGLAAAPGAVAQWPRGMIGTAPAVGTANGTVVMSPGDIWLPMGWYARSPVTLTLEGGRLVGLEGPPGEVDALRAHLASVGSPSAYRLDAVEIGLLWIDRPRPAALFEPGFADAFGVADHYGHVVVATGDYPTVGIACCLRKATVAVDEVAAVRAGQPQGELAPDVYEQAAHRYPL